MDEQLAAEAQTAPELNDYKDYVVEQVFDEASGELRLIYKRPGRGRRGKTYAHFHEYEGVTVAEGTKPIWLYLRLSKYHKDGSDAIDRQRIDLIRQLEAEGGWTIVGEYVDNDSASRFAARDRRGYSRLKQDIREGRVHALAFWKLDRVDRVAADNMAFIADCLDRSVELRSHQDSTEELNNVTGAAKLVRGVKALLGEIEADTMSERQLGAKLHLAENGFYHGGQRPIGWMPGPRIELPDGRRGKFLVPHPLEHPAVVDAVRMAAYEGRSTADIGEFWRDEYGIVGADGEPIYQGTVHRTLTSPRLLGYRMRDVPEKDRGDLLQYVVRYDADVVGACACPACTDDRTVPRVAPGEVLHRVGDPKVVMKPVCDLKTFLDLQAALGARDSRGARRTRAPYGSKVRPLSGLLICGRCGHKLTAQPRKLASGRIGIRYRCQSRQNRGKSVCEGLTIGGDGVEVWAEEFVLTYLDDDKLAQARRIVDEESTRLAGVPSVQTQLAEARREKAEMEKLRDSGKSYRGAEGLRDYRREMDSLNERIEKLTAELAVSTAKTGPHFEVESNVELRELWATLDAARKSAIYDRVIARIVVMPPAPGRTSFDPSRLCVDLRF